MSTTRDGSEFSRTKTLDRVLPSFEVFNVFNREQFGFPVNDFANANFGLILSTSVQYTPRTIQLGARYAF